MNTQPSTITTQTYLQIPLRAPTPSQKLRSLMSQFLYRSAVFAISTTLGSSSERTGSSTGRATKRVGSAIGGVGSLLRDCLFEFDGHCGVVSSIGYIGAGLDGLVASCLSNDDLAESVLIIEKALAEAGPPWGAVVWFDERQQTCCQ